MTALTIWIVCNQCVSGQETVTADWPCWRDPYYNSISKESNWNPDALTKKSRILWRTNVGYGHSAVSVCDEKLYTMGMKETITNNDNQYQDVVYCLDLRTGNPEVAITITQLQKLTNVPVNSDQHAYWVDAKIIEKLKSKEPKQRMKK